jgi:hypothetical protein
MSKLQKIINDTNKVDIAINAMLVSKNVRKAFLVQPIDYSEDISSPGPTTQKILKSITKNFNNLKIYDINQGKLVTLLTLSIKDIREINTSDIKLGEILSYPCAGDICRERNFVVTINVEINDIIKDIMTFICQKINADEIKEYVQKMNSSVLEGKFTFEITKIYTPQDFINKLKHNIAPADYMLEMKNVLSNHGFLLSVYLDNIHKINLTQKKYKKLLLTMLSYIHNNPIKVLYPLTIHLSRQVHLKQMHWEKDLLTHVYDITVSPVDIKHVISQNELEHITTGGSLNTYLKYKHKYLKMKHQIKESNKDIKYTNHK